MMSLNHFQSISQHGSRWWEFFDDVLLISGINGISD